MMNPMSKNPLGRTWLLAGVLACLPWASHGAEPVLAPAVPAPAANPANPAGPAIEDPEAWKASFTVTPYLQDMKVDEATVMWWSDKPSYGWVEYGETPDLGCKAETIVDGLREANVRRHAVRLTGLKPGTTYHYRVVNRPIEKFGAYKTTFLPDAITPAGTFTLPSQDPQAKIRCLVFNDLHCQPALLAPWKELTETKNADFVIFNGDCFADVGSEEKALSVLRGYVDQARLGERPAFFIRGNHETRGAFARSLNSLFKNPAGRYYYAFTRGSVRFVVVDCGEDKPDEHPAYSGLNDFSAFRQEVKAWLGQELASPDFKASRWHILVHHIPLYGDGASPFGAPLYLPELQKAKFDLAINGHTHRPALIPPLGAGDNPYPVLVGGGPDSKIATAIVFEADANGFSARLLDGGGQVVHSVESGPAGPVCR